MDQIFLTLTQEDLRTEMSQCTEEGLDFSSVQERYDSLLAVDLTDPSNQEAASELLDVCATLPILAGYKFDEPNSLDEIKASRPIPAVRLPGITLSEDELLDRFHGAWAGRCAGCLLGKPIEGWKSKRFWDLLKRTNQWPLNDYLRFRTIPEDFKSEHAGAEDWAALPFVDQVACMVEDDDLNYTTTGLAIMKKHGPAFTSRDVANFWMDNIPVLHTFTAERVAYRNLCMQIAPPASAIHRNPYREWIGAQIRADFWGYAAAGNPALAAEFAWRDASVSHVKNGIYGEMWAAAMVASSFVLTDPAQIIRAGMEQIPAKCRLADYLEYLLEWVELEVDYDTSVYRIHEMWNENSGHGWCHTISNAMIVALGLLYGRYDFGTSICNAVQPCFDTDCNGATVGSILGASIGHKALPEKWLAPLNDRLVTGVAGYFQVSLRDMAQETLIQYRRVSESV